MTTKTKDENLSEVGNCALATIVELVRALDHKSAAQDYAKQLSRDKCVELLTENDIEHFDDDDSVDDMRELVADNMADETIKPDDFEFDEDAARDRILEDPLSLEFRSGWVSDKSEMVADEYCLLITTGGPAVRIIGEIDQHGQSISARLEVQDWGTQWTEHITTGSDHDSLMTYVNCFCFE